MIKLRIIGTPAEIEESLERLAQVFEILETSELYTCRPPNEHKVRVYLDVAVPNARIRRSDISLSE